MKHRLPPVPASLGALAPEDRHAILEAFGGTPDELAWEWLEKVRRFASLYNRRLGAEGRRRFGRKAEDHLVWMIEILLAGADCRKETGPTRAQIANAALFCMDAVSRGPKDDPRLKRLTEDIRRTCLAGGGRHALDTPELGYSFERWKKEAEHPPQVVVISPSPFSLHTLAVLGLCDSLSIPVGAIVLRSFTLSRMIQELRRDGMRLPQKIWRKLVLRADENPDKSPISLKDLAMTATGGEASVVKWAERRRVKMLKFEGFGNPELLSTLTALGADLALFTGGGMVPKEMQAVFPKGVINPHMGHLPYYRGMDVVQWPILEGFAGNVGAHAHAMDKTLDTGPLLLHLTLPTAPFPSIGSLRNAVSALLPILLVDAALGVNSGRLKPIPQKLVYSLNYYMHEDFLQYIEEKLRKEHDGSTAHELVENFNAILDGIRSARSQSQR